MTNSYRQTCLQRCRDEQLRCAEYILSGGPDQRGATLGLFDWVTEEILLEEEWKSSLER